MIRIERGDEPEALEKERAKRLPIAHAAYARGELLDADLDGYSVAKEALFLAQKKKCAYCERRTDLSSAPTEHFRPKSGALRHTRGATRVRDNAHYWWLTWTWKNLFFACVRCNDQGHKGNFFWLKSKPCRVPSKNTVPDQHHGIAKERIATIDPAEEDPLRFLRWKPVDRSLPRVSWTWDIESRSGKGDRTIDLYRLKELAEDVGIHLSRHVLPRVEEIERDLGGGDIEGARARWASMTAHLLAPDAPMSFAAWCALRVWVPVEKRRNYGFAKLARPGLHP